MSKTLLCVGVLAGMAVAGVMAAAQTGEESQRTPVIYELFRGLFELSSR